MKQIRGILCTFLKVFKSAYYFYKSFSIHRVKPSQNNLKNTGKMLAMKREIHNLQESIKIHQEKIHNLQESDKFQQKKLEEHDREFLILKLATIANRSREMEECDDQLKTILTCIPPKFKTGIKRSHFDATNDDVDILGTKDINDIIKVYLKLHS